VQCQRTPSGARLFFFKPGEGSKPLRVSVDGCNTR
jgi:hypothetical protein